MEIPAGGSSLAMEARPCSCSQLVKLQKWVLSVTAFLKHGAYLLPSVHVACRAGVNGNDLC